tara:strand:- start:975 stop:1178 length:204 start_codon:yes stop_codon:yes gene_type:complete
LGGAVPFGAFVLFVPFGQAKPRDVLGPECHGAHRALKRKETIVVEMQCLAELRSFADNAIALMQLWF